MLGSNADIQRLIHKNIGQIKLQVAKVKQTMNLYQHTPREVVAMLHEEVNFIEAEVPELLQKNHRGQYRIKMSSGERQVSCIVTDNRKRWELINELYKLQMDKFLMELRRAFYTDGVS